VNIVFFIYIIYVSLYDPLNAEEPNSPHLCEGRHSYTFVANNKDGIAVRRS
jgi:hypothetical protein